MISSNRVSAGVEIAVEEAAAAGEVQAEVAVVASGDSEAPAEALEAEAADQAP